MEADQLTRIGTPQDTGIDTQRQRPETETEMETQTETETEKETFRPSSIKSRNDSTSKEGLRRKENTRGQYERQAMAYPHEANGYRWNETSRTAVWTRRSNSEALVPGLSGGHQSTPNAPWEISGPALVMIRHGDFDALELLRAGDRACPQVTRIFDFTGFEP